MSIKHQPSRAPLTLMCPGAVHSPLVSSSTPVPLLSAWVLGFCRLCSPHSLPWSFSSLLGSVSWKCGQEIRKQEEQRSFLLWFPRQWMLLETGDFCCRGGGEGLPPHPPSGACWLGKLQEAAGASSGGQAGSTGRILIAAHHSFLFIALPPSLPPLCSASPHKSFVPNPSHLKYIPWFFFFLTEHWLTHYF